MNGAEAPGAGAPMGTIILQPAIAGDLEAVSRLLAAADLPTSGLQDQFPVAYAVLRQGGLLVGVAGIERHGAVGLLRSVAVHPACRSRGWGRQLVHERLQRAALDGLAQVYLLTTTAAPFFRGLGFVEARRESAPAELLASAEFRYACPASATCLVRTLK